MKQPSGDTTASFPAVSNKSARHRMKPAERGEQRACCALYTRAEQCTGSQDMFRAVYHYLHPSSSGFPPCLRRNTRRWGHPGSMGVWDWLGVTSGGGALESSVGSCTIASRFPRRIPLHAPMISCQPTTCIHCIHPSPLIITPSASSISRFLSAFRPLLKLLSTHCRGPTGGIRRGPWRK
jgi:hypothetical protein